MSTFVLVHGGGHGGWCYQRVARRLEAAGHTVYSPSLTGSGDRSHLMSPDVDLETHITEVANLLFFEDLSDVILVGHSIGGMVARGAADRADGRVGKLVYLDAPQGRTAAEALPMFDLRAGSKVVDGVELILLPSEDLLGFFGVTDPEDVAWALPRLTPHAWKCFDQELSLQNEQAVAAIPRYLIVASGSVDLGVHPEELLAAARAEDRLWVIEGGHDLMITAPRAVADSLAQIAAEGTAWAKDTGAA
ncbi:esterase [Acrocarpospora pleiomorpha]|uniref:Esterase n=1 Tax=Acrocarpospora pleiomorpha TaxID=90975 RepID=A0A5M3XEZ2_9ACTN|nr:alpha/beta hydrolase [Acrocarpospora pleiomorpha]GES17523.1 esterase [Acrocarpospora pleiomorpha]